MRGDARANEIPPPTRPFPLSLPFTSLDLVVFLLRFIERRSNFPFALPLKRNRPLGKINHARLPNDDSIAKICRITRFAFRGDKKQASESTDKDKEEKERGSGRERIGAELDSVSTEKRKFERRVSALARA